MSLARRSAAVTALLALAACDAAKSPPPVAVPLATPPGVTLRETRGYRDAANIYVPGPVAYADAEGHLAYIRPENAGCTGECADAWLPLAATVATTFGADWSLIARDDGTKQWSFKGNPLYTAKGATDATPYKTCTVPSRRSDAAHEAPAAEAPAPCVALFEPGKDLPVPDGIAVADVANANGAALVDTNGLTLYAFSGDPKRDGLACTGQPCSVAWTPLAAPELAVPVGEFSVVARADATPQWAFRGRPLYLFKADLAVGDANGIGVDPKWDVAVVARYFQPPGVVVRLAAGFGTIWTTSAGMTLYDQNRGGERRRSTARVRSNAVLTCDGDCRTQWHPFAAPAEAYASSFWTVVTSPEGGKQWAYRDKPLFTYAEDRQPGEMKGKYRYNYLLRDAEDQVVKVTVGYEPGEGPVYWRPAFPY